MMIHNTTVLYIFFRTQWMTKFKFSPHLLLHTNSKQIKIYFVIFISRIHHIALGRKEPDLACGVERRTQPCRPPRPPSPSPPHSIRREPEEGQLQDPTQITLGLAHELCRRIRRQSLSYPQLWKPEAGSIARQLSGEQGRTDQASFGQQQTTDQHHLVASGWR